MKIKEKLPFTLPSPVEAALEANEAALSPNRKNVDKTTQPNEATHTKLERQVSDESPPKLVRVPAGSLPPLQISPSRQFNSNNNNNYNRNKYIEMPDDECEDVGKAGGEVNSNATTKVRYEIPENSLSRTAARILGNKRELEMHEFSSSRLLNENGDGYSSRRIPAMPEIDPSGDRKHSTCLD